MKYILYYINVIEEIFLTYTLPFSSRKTQIELGKLKKLECPFKNDDPAKICKLTEKQKSDHHDFRMHFFLHYRNSKDWVISHWTERLKSLEKGDQLSMYCDLCSIR
jgi:hypothetical protein